MLTKFAKQQNLSTFFFLQISKNRRGSRKIEPRQGKKAPAQDLPSCAGVF